jgi:hypothetical protein
MNTERRLNQMSKTLDEIIREAVAEADARAVKDIERGTVVPGEVLPHAIGCNGNGVERRLPGKAEANAAQARAKLAPGHYAVFCSHNKLYTEPCTKCGRTRQLAERNVSVVIGSLKRLV